MNPLRPIVLTHAGDGSNRVFVATQHGVIHVFPNDPKATETKVFLDIQDRVQYNDNTNEEGLLGVAFHPKFKENGEFFVLLHAQAEVAPRRDGQRRLAVPASARTTRPSRPRFGRADPRIPQAAVLEPRRRHHRLRPGRLPVHRPRRRRRRPTTRSTTARTSRRGSARFCASTSTTRTDGKNYAIPRTTRSSADDDALPEIWAYGVRNPWRIAFDRKTGQLWAGDVGQNLYEEIDIIQKGGNYGWNRRES